MTNRLRTRLAELRDIERKALVTFITAGDPVPVATVPALHALVAAGADVLELGIPFSDPEAEGPAIQAATERALAQGMTLRKTLAMVAEFRVADAQTPVVLMGYLNSVLRMGEEAFAAAAAQAGVDGLIMVNLPPEEGQTLQQALRAVGIDLIYLIAPTTTPERQQTILSRCGGFVYYVSLKGITGAGNLEPRQVSQEVAAIRSQTELPVMVGFGIKNGASAAAVASAADGVVVGSALVTLLGEGLAAGDAQQAPAPEELEERRSAMAALVTEIRAALDSLAG